MEAPDSILKGDRPFRPNLVEIDLVVYDEKIFKLFFAYLFLICIIGQNQQKLKVHMKTRNIIC